MKLKKILATLLAIAMVLTVIAVPVFAGSAKYEFNGATYDSLSSLTTAVKESNTTDVNIKMLANDTIDSMTGTPYDFGDGKNVTIDFNGNRITFSVTQLFKLMHGTMTWLDNSAAGNGGISYSIGYSGGTFLQLGTSSGTGKDYAVLNIESGVYESNVQGSLFNLQANATANIKGGYINKESGGKIHMITNPNNVALNVSGGKFNNKTNKYNNPFYGDNWEFFPGAYSTTTTLSSYAVLTGGYFTNDQYYEIRDTDKESDVADKKKTLTGDAAIADGYQVYELPAADPAYAEGYRYVIADKPPVVVTNVAKISTTEYATLADAIAAVPKDGTKTTITMIDDEAIKSNNGVFIEKTQNIVLELNGHTISGSADNANASQVIENRGTLTIQDNTDTDRNGTGSGMITSVASQPDQKEIPGYANNTILNRGGTLTIESGLIQNNVAVEAGSSRACYAIDNSSNSFGPAYLYIKGGKMTKTSATTIRQYACSATDDNYVEITGGIIENGSRTAFQTQLQDWEATKAAKVTVKIKGGEIIAPNYYAWYDYPFSNNTFDNVTYEFTGGCFDGWLWTYGGKKMLKGGYFTSSDIDDLVADGYQKIDNPDANKNIYPYKVVPIGTPEIIIDPEETEKADMKDDKGQDITEDDKKEVVKIVTENPAVNDFTNTGIPAVVEDNKEEIKEQLKKEAKNEGIDDVDDQIDEKVSLDNSLYIYLKTAVVSKIEGVGVLSNEMTFDVTPIVSTKVTTTNHDGQQETKTIMTELHKTTTPVKFRLPVSSLINAGTPAKVSHKGEPFCNALVQTENGENFIEVITDEFSEFSYMIENSLNWEYNSDSGIYGSEGAKRGVVRLLFDSGIADEYIKSSKIVFFNTAVFEDAEQSPWYVEDVEGLAGAFSADLYNLDPDNFSPIYGFGFIRASAGDEEVEIWSGLNTCEPMFIKDLGIDFK